jgi:uncharacterized RDD family membrane protein YckC
VVTLTVASPVRHGAAVAVDGLGTAAVTLGLVAGVLAALGVPATWQSLVDVVHRDPARFLPLCVAVVVGVFGWSLWPLLLGATAGQRLCGLRLVGAEGAAPSRARLVVRAVVATVGTLAFLAGPAWALFLDRWRRNPGDVVARTVVVER